MKNIFRRVRARQPSREILMGKLDSLRPPSEGARVIFFEDTPPPSKVLELDEVTGVLDLALEQLAQAQAEAAGDLQRAAQRLRTETAATCALARRVSTPPPPKE